MTASLWRRNLVVLWTANVLTAMGLMAMLPFFPQILRGMGETDEAAISLWSGVIVGAAPLMAAIMAGFWGGVGDRVGRRAMVLRSLIAITIFVGLMGFARTAGHLLLLRIGQGLFSGFMAPTVTLVSVLAPPDRQGRVGGTMQTAQLLGSVAGPAFGGFVGAHAGLKGLAWSCAALSLVGFVIVLLFAVEPERPRPAAAPETTGARPRIGFGAFVRLSAQVLTDLRTALRIRPLRALLIAAFLVRLGISAVNPTLLQHVERLAGEVSDTTARLSGFVFTAYPAAVLLTVTSWARFADRRGAARVLTVCIAGAAVSLAAQAFVTTPLQLAAFRFLTGAFSAGVFPAAFAAAAAYSASDRRGGTVGLAFSALTLGLALGPAAGGLVVARLGFTALYVGAALVLAAALLPVPVLARSAAADRA